MVVVEEEDRGERGSRGEAGHNSWVVGWRVEEMVVGEGREGERKGADSIGATQPTRLDSRVTELPPSLVLKCCWCGNQADDLWRHVIIYTAI